LLLTDNFSTQPLLWISCTLALLTAACKPQLEVSEPAADPRILSVSFLLNSDSLNETVSTIEFKLPETALPPSNHFEGTLQNTGSNNDSNIRVVVDTFATASDPAMNISTLPMFLLQLVQDGSDIVPVQRGPQRGEHPYWEFIPEPGKTWDEPADGGWSRAALPFSLKEKNQNCTHNGLLTFLYRNPGEISRLVWQISSETCLYLKADMWGTVTASYVPESIPASDQLIKAYRQEVASRLPVRPLEKLTEEYPGMNLAALLPPGRADISVYGLVINGIHYRSECPTRAGPYPYCDVLDLPSYSLAKSIFAGSGYMLLTREWPEFATTTVSQLLPECRLADKRWDDVSPAQLLNMTTGNFDSAVTNRDEDSRKMNTFFLDESHAGKIQFSCEAWPRKSLPGTQMVYHTTDTYLLGAVMNAFLQQKQGSQADIYQDLIYQQLFKPLELSPVLRWTQRTYDEESQAFTGFGLIFHSDDVARIAQSLNSDSPISRKLAGADLDAAMFRSGKPEHTSPDPHGLAYNNGFWGVDVSAWVDCPGHTWVPFMSGYGGISVAMFPNGSVYYYFTDSNQHGFQNAAVEINKALNYCKES